MFASALIHSRAAVAGCPIPRSVFSQQRKLCSATPTQPCTPTPAASLLLVAQPLVRLPQQRLRISCHEEHMIWDAAGSGDWRTCEGQHTASSGVASHYLKCMADCLLLCGWCSVGRCSIQALSKLAQKKQGGCNQIMYSRNCSRCTMLSDAHCLVQALPDKVHRRSRGSFCRCFSRCRLW